MNAKGIVQGLDRLKHLVAAVAWTAMLAYSIYFVVTAYLAAKPFTPFHVLVPFVLFLVCIRAVKRYLQLYGRRSEKVDAS
jgi:hypothetical protein